MKKLKQLCVAAVFTLVLATATLAGDIQTPGVTQQPPNEPSATILGGIESVPSGQNPEAISDSVANIALSLLQTLLSVF